MRDKAHFYLGTKPAIDSLKRTLNDGGIVLSITLHESYRSGKTPVVSFKVNGPMICSGQ